MVRENVVVGFVLGPAEHTTIAAGRAQTRYASSGGGLDWNTVEADVGFETCVERGLGADTR